MSHVPNILTWVDHDCGRKGLVHLCDVRGLPRRKSNEEMRRQLARSYRGDVEAVIADLRKKDLAAILGSHQGIYTDGHWFRLTNVGAYTLDELQAAMTAALVEGDTSDFVRGHGDEDDLGEDDDDADDNDSIGDDPDNGGDEDDDDSADDDDDDGLDVLRERLAAGVALMLITQHDGPDAVAI